MLAGSGQGKGVVCGSQSKPPGWEPKLGVMLGVPCWSFPETLGLASHRQP